MNHADFLEFRRSWRTQHPQGVDWSETNLYRSLPGACPEAFPPMVSPLSPRAGYRCHVAEAFLEVCGWPATWVDRVGVSQGVRDSLRILMTHLSGCGALGVPSDVYPVYRSIAQESHMVCRPYEARLGLPWAGLDSASFWLICDPLKPWGGSLTVAQADHLVRWVRADSSRRIVIDSAYAIPVSAGVQRLIDEQAAVVLVSLSKGWLVPDQVGLCLMPRAWAPDLRPLFIARAKDPERLRLGYAALTDHADRPSRVAACLAQCASNWEGSRPIGSAPFCSPPSGYFFTSNRPWADWLKQGVLMMPATIFGSSWPGCVGSTLSPI